MKTEEGKSIKPCFDSSYSDILCWVERSEGLSASAMFDGGAALSILCQIMGRVAERTRF
jgi:hypothetical protein